MFLGETEAQFPTTAWLHKLILYFYTIFIELVFMSHTLRLAKEVYIIYFYESS